MPRKRNIIWRKPSAARHAAHLTGFWAGCCAVVFIAALPFLCGAQRRPRTGDTKVIQFSEPNLQGSVTVEQAISRRRSVRQFADRPLDYVQIGQLAWAGQGITDKQRGLRAAPSAGALYPIELYFVTPQGVFAYHPQEHSLERISSSDVRKQLSEAALNQEWVAEAACDIVIAGSVRKLMPKYGNKANQFMLLEAGCVAENVQLQAVALGLASVPVGAFETKEVARICQLSSSLEPILILSVGFPAGEESPEKTKSGALRAVLVVPGFNFTDEELFVTQRVLAEASIETVIASSKIGPLQGVLGGLAASEVTFDKLRVADFDAVIFVGGPGAAAYFTDSNALALAKQAAEKRKVIAAISFAPAILANAGVLKGFRATGFLPVREQIQKGGAKYTGTAVERDGLIITASDPSVTIPFAQTIIAVLKERQPKPDKAP